MSTFGHCPVCREYDILVGSRFVVHRCKPAWECRLETMDADDWRTVYAADEEIAAEKFAERYDCESAEYSIISSGGDGYFIFVRKPDASEAKKFSISAESVPHYTAIECNENS